MLGNPLLEKGLFTKIYIELQKAKHVVFSPTLNCSVFSYAHVYFLFTCVTCRFHLSALHFILYFQKSIDASGFDFQNVRSPIYKFYKTFPYFPYMFKVFLCYIRDPMVYSLSTFWKFQSRQKILESIREPKLAILEKHKPMKTLKDTLQNPKHHLIVLPYFWVLIICKMQ